MSQAGRGRGAGLAVAGLIFLGGEAPGQALVEKSVDFEGTKFRVVRVVPARVRLMWKAADGKPLRTFAAVQKQLAGEGKEAALLMNGGIFEPGGVPSGLYVEGGVEQRPLNLEPGEGNFFLHPNGVFLTRKGPDGVTAAVWSSKVYANWLKIRKKGELPAYAVQSGPLLLQRGVVHLKFNRDSKSKLARNGVGVDREGRVVLVATAKGETVNLHGFARFFRSLGCENALYLDGVISHMAVNPPRGIKSRSFGSFVVVVR